jgi:sulfur carrier protein
MLCKPSKTGIISSMKVMVNGKEMELAGGVSISGLLKALGLSDRRVAVEHNLKILTVDNYAETVLSDGDTVEIMSFVGGG